jgi:putative ABC transport system permease protein
MTYSLAILWHERHRFLPAVLAVTFSGLLIALQCGLLIGTLSIVSLPVDHTSADIWVGAPVVVSVDVGHPIPERWRSRLEDLPEIAETEVYIQQFAFWSKPNGGTEWAIIIGSRLKEGALGTARELTPDLQVKLTEPGAVVVDASDLERLGLSHGIGETAEVNGQRVRIVGLVHGLRGLAGPYVFCSVDTARKLNMMTQDQTTYILARCRNKADARAVVERLGKYPDLEAFTSDDFSLHSRWHWLRMSGAGISLGCAALLGLLVGAVVTSQTLYAATVASLREYAVLRALGIPRWRLAVMVVTQSFWIGLAGIVVAVPAIFGLAQVIRALDAQVFLAPWLLGLAALVTLAMALGSGLAALSSLRLLELTALLR